MTNRTSNPRSHGELEDPIALANRVLDRSSGDPDDDLAILARQLLRRQEWAETWHRALETVATVLDVPCAGDPPMLLRDINEAIQNLRSPPETFDDSARLEWVMRNVSGAEWRRLGVLYGDAAGIRLAINAAMAASPSKTERQEADSSVTSDKCEHGIPRRYCTAVHEPPRCLVADCPESTADGQAMCAEHMQRIEP